MLDIGRQGHHVGASKPRRIAKADVFDIDSMPHPKIAGGCAEDQEAPTKVAQRLCHFERTLARERTGLAVILLLMQKHVAFLHTSPVHVETFEQLMRTADSHAKVEHVVDEALLVEAQRAGADDPALVVRVQEAMKGAATRGAAVVVCTCSTIGGAAERTPTDGRFAAARIDRAMADRAVELGPRVLVVAALESTLGPTTALIEESAVALGARVELKHLVVQGAWSHFLGGDRVAYIEAIVAAVSAAALHTLDVIVLAQASMSPASEALGGLGVEVLSSPRLGVRNVVARLNA